MAEVKIPGKVNWLNVANGFSRSSRSTQCTPLARATGASHQLTVHTGSTRLAPVQEGVADGHVMVSAALRKQLGAGLLHNVVARAVSFLWLTLRARWVTLTYRGVILRARWVTFRWWPRRGRCPPP
jgi:hypothetical protein